MRRMKSFKYNIISFISAVILGFVGVTYSTDSFAAEDVTVEENIEVSASDGNIIIGIKGYDYTSDQKEILDRINEIRKEACNDGNVPNPNNPTKMLTPADYHEIKLGVNCTKAAKIRSAEAAVRLAHARPNSTICSQVLQYYLNNSFVYCGENLAWNEKKLSDLEGWYSEKKDWVSHGTGETGHYENLINPDYEYCGIATFNPVNDEIFSYSGYKLDWCCTAGEFSADDVAVTAYKGAQDSLLIQKMEISVGSVTNITAVGNQILHVGDTENMSLQVDIVHGGAAKCTIKNCSVYDGVSWKSSDASVAEVDSVTGVVTAKNTGKIKLTASIGSGNSLREQSFNLAVVPENVVPVEAVNPDMVYAESYKTPTLSNSVSIKLSDDTCVEVTPIWDSYDSKKLQSHFKSIEFDVLGKACGLDVVQKVHINAAKITNVYCKESKGSSYVVVKEKTTDSGTPIVYPSVGISLSNGYSWTYPATWITKDDENYKKRAGGKFTEQCFTTVYTDDGSKRLEASFELVVNPAKVVDVAYDESDISTPSGTAPDLPVATVTWSNGDIDNAESPGKEYGYIKWNETEESKTFYKKREGGSYQITGTYYDAINKELNSKSTTVKVNVTPATVSRLEYDNTVIIVKNGISPASALPKQTTVYWSNGDKEIKDIKWDSISEDTIKHVNNSAVTYTVEGTVDCGNDIVKKVQTKYTVLPISVEDVKPNTKISSDGAMYMIQKNGSLSYIGPVNKKITSVTVPDSISVCGKSYPVTDISANAFKNCAKLKSVKLGKNVTTIGDNAFYKCTSLTSIVIPKSVKTIGKKAFYGCKKLKKVTIKTTKLKKKTIGSKAFKGVYKKVSFKCPKSKVKNYKKWIKKAGAPNKAKYKK